MLTSSPSRLILTEDQQFLAYRKALIDFFAHCDRMWRRTIEQTLSQA
jgi:hypothetical protein